MRIIFCTVVHCITTESLNTPFCTYLWHWSPYNKRLSQAWCMIVFAFKMPSNLLQIGHCLFWDYLPFPNFKELFAPFSILFLLKFNTSSKSVFSPIVTLPYWKPASDFGCFASAQSLLDLLRSPMASSSHNEIYSNSV